MDCWNELEQEVRYSELYCKSIRAPEDYPSLQFNIENKLFSIPGKAWAGECKVTDNGLYKCLTLLEYCAFDSEIILGDLFLR